MTGYRDPPKEHRFPPGESGNSRGRPKNSFATELRRELVEKITWNGVKVSKQRAIIKTIVAAALSGDFQAAMALFSLCIRVFGTEAQDESRPAGAPEDEELLKAHVEREIQRRQKSIKSTDDPNKSEGSSHE